MAINIQDSFLLKEGGSSVSQAFESPAALISLIVKNLFVIAGVILFFFIVVSGMSMVLNPGNSDKSKQSSQTLTSAIAGFFILFASYWIIRLIEGITKLQILGVSP